MKNELRAVVTPLKRFSDALWIDGNKKWVKIYPYSTWTHPQFSETTITPEIATAMKTNFDKRVRGVDEIITYDHGLDPAKGGKRAGTYKEVDVRHDGLWGLIEFTETAKAEIESGEWRYFSGEHFDEWEHPQRPGETYQYVLAGGAVTNKPWVKDGAIPLNFSELFIEREGDPTGSADSHAEVIMDPPAVTNESADLEHSDPGTGSPPIPQTEERNDDNAADTGSRRDTPPVEHPTNDVDTKLREILGLGADADIIKATEDLLAEVKPLREAAKSHSEKKAFAEMYPEEAKELEEGRKERMIGRAKTFSEKFENILDAEGKPTNKGFPTVVLDKLQEVHKSFSEGTVTVNDLGDLVETIGRTGLVDYQEHGTSRRDDDIQVGEDPAKQFSEKVVEIQAADKLQYEDAIAQAAIRYPSLYDGYRRQVTGGRH